MFPHDPDRNYFEGQTAGLKNVMAEAASAFFHECLNEAGWKPADIQHLFAHQVSAESSRMIARMTGVLPSCSEEVFARYGNTAAASIPLAMYERFRRGEINKGDNIALLGLAAGVSVSVQLLKW
jgi:3-oxoacyl-[acyl-carrier-protein] synthase-3